MLSRKIIVWALAGIGVVVVFGYSFFALKDVVQGPRIELTAPQSGYATTTPLSTVAGRVIRGSVLTLNGATTTLDLAGNFKESLLLSPGYNIMTLEAKDRYERTVKERIEMTLLVMATSTRDLATSTIEVIQQF